MKNPWMSLWLSGANAWTSAARGMMAAEIQKTQNAMMREAARQATELWFPHMKTDKSRTARQGRRKTTRR